MKLSCVLSVVVALLIVGSLGASSEAKAECEGVSINVACDSDEVYYANQSCGFVSSFWHSAVAVDCKRVGQYPGHFTGHWTELSFDCVYRGKVYVGPRKYMMPWTYSCPVNP